MDDFLRDYQYDAVDRMRDGCILNGGVGSGKSRTALYFYFKEYGGCNRNGVVNRMYSPPDLYIITTAKKRDSLEWEGELANYGMSTHEESNGYSNTIVIDSWNNIKKYVEIKGAFFIFDEDRVIGKGAWVKAFLKICKSNRWILLSATPGDTWSDYIPVFIANGFYRNRSDFNWNHVVYSHYANFPKVERYVNTGRLLRLRRKILVAMDYERHTQSHHIDIWVDYNKKGYKYVNKERKSVFKSVEFDGIEYPQPIANAAELCYELRKIINTDESRQQKVIDILKERGKAIVFYNFDYELDILKNLEYPEGTLIAELNGHKHQDIPKGDTWVYLVQYNAGAEGWNCTRTDTIIFYSQNYSYRMMTQAAGRIDRLTTPYQDLYYYHLKCGAGIDLAIAKALKEKKKFNETKFYEKGE